MKASGGRDVNAKEGVVGSVGNSVEKVHLVCNSFNEGVVGSCVGKSGEPLVKGGASMIWCLEGKEFDKPRMCKAVVLVVEIKLQAHTSSFQAMVMGKISTFSGALASILVRRRYIENNV
ncbi:hypothetical protein LWI28_001055 [Acer negundo]|uniref:Uncharacterized protein n=1 Tax=Acer negundo TaxID=4023 RepID=A0AAD5NER4_ACENE|nr:hypothetical protein LWI28_001055 [Acer negundo]KAK4834331.1 hypothetical protein QYF36_020892 [Acer negundo]